HTGEHFVAFIHEQPGQALAEKGRVLGYHDAHGILASTTVGPPRGLCTENCPSSAATRRARPVSPEPVISAPPHPSSTTVTVTTRPSAATVTDTLSAPECFAEFVTPSAAT